MENNNSTKRPKQIKELTSNIWTLKAPVETKKKRKAKSTISNMTKPTSNTTQFQQ